MTPSFTIREYLLLRLPKLAAERSRSIPIALVKDPSQSARRVTSFACSELPQAFITNASLTDLSTKEERGVNWGHWVVRLKTYTQAMVSTPFSFSALADSI